MSVLSVWWLGVVIGYIVTAFFVLPPMYRSSMFTNAEYLEARFGVGARVISALVQVQYRTNILAGIAISLQLILTRVMGIEGLWAWTAVVAFAGMATFYSARGGLKTIAWADIFLTVSMILGTVILWFSDLVVYRLGRRRRLGRSPGRTRLQRGSRASRLPSPSGCPGRVSPMR